MSRIRPAVLVVLLVLALSIVVPFPVSAQVGDPPVAQAPEPVVTVLSKLAQSIGVGVVLSFLFKDPGWFSGMPSKAKWWIIFGLSLGLPVLAQLLLAVVPAHVWEIINPYWTALAWGFVAWAASQAAFETYIKPSRTAEDGA